MSMVRAGVKDMRGKPNRLAVQIAILIVLLASAAQAVPTAQAYDRSSCSQGVSWNQVDQISLNGGEADYGDELHLGGAPVGKAVVCWDGNLAKANATRVQIIGKMYNDNPISGGDTVCTRGVFSFIGGGTVRARHETPVVCSLGGLQSEEDTVIVNLPIAKVKIELFASFQPLPGDPVHEELQLTTSVRFGH